MLGHAQAWRQPARRGSGSDHVAGVIFLGSWGWLAIPRVIVGGRVIDDDSERTDTEKANARKKGWRTRKTYFLCYIIGLSRP